MYKKISSEIQVRPSDLDFNFHVHAAKYVEYLLAARYEQLRDAFNYSVEKAFSNGFAWFVKNINLNYLYPSTISKKIVVTTWINSMEGKNLDIGVEISCNGKLSLSGKMIFGLVDIKTGRGINIPEDMKEYFLSFKEEINE